MKEELQRLEEGGIIIEIQEPMDRCAPVVPVLKKSGMVCICADFKQLKKAVQKERYTLDDILHKKQGAKVFSKLDTALGFLQLPLDDVLAKHHSHPTFCWLLLTETTIGDHISP